MAARLLVDTNVLVYAHDIADLPKQSHALEVLTTLQALGAGLLSVQILAEFFWVATRRLMPPLTGAEAARQMELLVRSWPVLDLTPLVLLEAIRGAQEHGMALWDAQVWATAKLNQVPVVLTEDIPGNRVVEGVRFVNPFAPHFHLEDWLAL